MSSIGVNSRSVEELNGATVLVTGASRGIGAATAAACAGAGARIVRIARSPLPPLLEVSLHGGSHTTPASHDFRADLTNPVEREAVCAAIEAAVGIPDIVVSNAGAFTIASLDQSNEALVQEQIAVNLLAPFALARWCLPAMRRRGYGTHLLVGSVADHQAFPLNAAYAASKFGVRGLHEVLLEEYRGSGVRCVLVSPGPTDTSVWDPIDPDHRDGFRRRADMLRPDDVAEAILWAVTRPPHVQVDWLRLGPI